MDNLESEPNRRESLPAGSHSPAQAGSPSPAPSLSPPHSHTEGAAALIASGRSGDGDGERALYREGYAWEGASLVALVRGGTEGEGEGGTPLAARDGWGEGRGEGREGGGGALGASSGTNQAKPVAMEILLDDGVTITVELDSGEKRLAELGYKQDLRRALVRHPSTALHM